MLRKYRIHLTCMLFLILLLSILTACSSTMPEGLTIAGVPVGGFSKEEAIAVVSDYFDQTYSTRHMNLQINDQSFSISPESTKIQLDTTAAVEAAFSGKSSGAFDISPYLTVDETSIRSILEQIRNDHFLSTFSESTFSSAMVFIKLSFNSLGFISVNINLLLLKDIYNNLLSGF